MREPHYKDRQVLALYVQTRARAERSLLSECPPRVTVLHFLRIGLGQSLLHLSEYPSPTFIR